jgi:hypothetical protein
VYLHVHGKGNKLRAVRALRRRRRRAGPGARQRDQIPELAHDPLLFPRDHQPLVHRSIDELAAEHRRTDRLRRDAARPPPREGLAVVTEQDRTLSRFAELA